MFVMLSRLFIAALWSPAGKGLSSWLLFVMPNCVCFTFPCVILGQVWCFIVLIPNRCGLSSFVHTSLLGVPNFIFLPISYKFKFKLTCNFSCFSEFVKMMTSK